MIEPAAFVPAIDDTIPNAWTPVAPTSPTGGPSVTAATPAVSTEFAPHIESPSIIEPERESTPTPSPIRHEEPVSVRKAPGIPRVSLELPPDSGLVLIETRSVPTQSAEETELPRPRRVRPPRVTVADEPLQLVETQKEPTPPAA
jgi:hypothetical protein